MTIENNSPSKERMIGSLLGLAIGDAVGTTLEFKPRGTFTPITDMVGGGPFRLEKGKWTDDTSMAICLGHSLAAKKGFDAADQMNRYCNWWQTGYMSSTDRCFDIGNTVLDALQRYLNTKQAFAGAIDPGSAGNGSLMRLAPIVIFFHANFDDLIHYAGESSRTTHGAAECIDSCRYFANLLYSAFIGKSKHDILSNTSYRPTEPKVKAIAAGEYMNKTRDDIKGSGYVIDCLEAALWCFANTETFSDAILCAANLGDDADTTAAVCGQLAGAFYGVDGIRKDWLDSVYLKDDIQSLAASLIDVGAKHSPLK